MGIGIGLTHFGVSVHVPTWLVPLPLILLGLIAAIQPAQIDSRIAMIGLLGIGLYLGYGQSWHGSHLATTIGVAIGAMAALATGIGFGTMVSATLGGFFIRVFGIGLAVAGILMLLDRGFLR
ncbi:membrane hypothetical protein [uncultured Gammaproteobacteria bacterium]